MNEYNIKLPKAIQKYRNIISDWYRLNPGKHYYHVVLKDGFIFSTVYANRQALFETLSEASSALSRVKKVA